MSTGWGWTGAGSAGAQAGGAAGFWRGEGLGEEKQPVNCQHIGGQLVSLVRESMVVAKDSEKRSIWGASLL